MAAADGTLEQACPRDGADGAAQDEHDLGGRADVDRAAGGRRRCVGRGDGGRGRAGRGRAKAEGHSFKPALESGGSNGFVPGLAGGARGNGRERDNEVVRSQPRERVIGASGSLIYQL